MDWTSRQAPRQISCVAEGITACPTGFRINLVNTGDITLKGLELDAQLAVTRNFSIDFSMGITDYKLKDPVANGGPNLYPAQASPSSCASVAAARRVSSSARISVDDAAKPRRASAASKAAGSSRIRRISCMAAAYARRSGAVQCGNQRPIER